MAETGPWSQERALLCGGSRVARRSSKLAELPFPPAPSGDFECGGREADLFSMGQSPWRPVHGRCSRGAGKGRQSPVAFHSRQVRAGFSPGGMNLSVLLAGEEFEGGGEREQSKPWRRWRKEARATGRGPSLQGGLWKASVGAGGVRCREGHCGKVGS